MSDELYPKKKDFNWNVFLLLVAVGLLALILYSVNTTKKADAFVIPVGYHVERMSVWQVCQDTIDTGDNTSVDDCSSVVNAAFAYYAVHNDLTMGGEKI